MRKLLFTLALLISCLSQAKLKIAILDTGIKPDKIKDLKLCPNESIDFTNSNLNDDHGHGTNIAGLISQQIPKNLDYCLVIIKVFDINNLDSAIESTIKGFRYAQMIRANIINYSGGGASSDKEEKATIINALNKGIKIFVAAGNQGKDLDGNCDYFPACYDKRLVIVGSKTSKNKISENSNRGKVVSVWEIGKDREALDIVLSGTSQATAVATGRYAYEKLTGK
jgi:subtilisin family serine protease